MINYLDMGVGESTPLNYTTTVVMRVQGGLCYLTMDKALDKVEVSVFVPYDIAATDYANMLKQDNPPAGPAARLCKGGA